MEFKANKKGENFAVRKFGRSKELLIKKYDGYYYVHLQNQGYPYCKSKGSFSLGTDELEEIFLLQKDIQKAVKTLKTKAFKTKLHKKESTSDEEEHQPSTSGRSTEVTHKKKQKSKNKKRVVEQSSSSEEEEEEDYWSPKRKSAICSSWSSDEDIPVKSKKRKGGSYFLDSEVTETKDTNQ